MKFVGAKIKNHGQKMLIIGYVASPISWEQKLLRVKNCLNTQILQFSLPNPIKANFNLNLPLMMH